MNDLIIIYITCDSVGQAKIIGRQLLEKRLCGCVNVIPNMQPMSWWPPKQNKIDTSEEVVLLVKTLKNKFSAVEKEIKDMKLFEVPCLIALPTEKVNKEYYDWIKGEIK